MVKTSTIITYINTIMTAVMLFFYRKVPLHNLLWKLIRNKP